MTIGTDIREYFCPSYKSGEVDGFTNRQHINRLVYYESFRYVGRAIERETEIKKWRREQKIALMSRSIRRGRT